MFRAYKGGWNVTCALPNGLTLVLKIRVFLPFICTISFSFIATSLQSNKHVVIIPRRYAEIPNSTRRTRANRSLAHNAPPVNTTVAQLCQVAVNNTVRQRQLNRTGSCHLYVKPFYFPGGRINRSPSFRERILLLITSRKSDDVRCCQCRSTLSIVKNRTSLLLGVFFFFLRNWS